MTSSLVGSEMCIRDRNDTLAALLKPLQEFRKWTFAAGLNTREKTLWHSPVSYTHLTLPTICSV
eukprot:8457845-Prorocentrum_lima.AAC.1